MNDAQHSVDNSAKTRDPTRGILLLYAAGVIVALGVIPVIHTAQSFSGFSWFGLAFVPVALMTPMLIMIGYAFAIPLLWFRNTIVRCKECLLV